MTSTPSTMRALRQTSRDGPRGLQLVTDAIVPSPGPGEVVIKVIAAGVNFSDVMQSHGTYEGGPVAPYIAGFEAAGQVVAQGAGVTTPALGSRVIGIGSGAFAEYMAMPTETAVPVPDDWKDEEALGLVLNWATALAALRPLGRLAPDETVLITAAAGGVGQAAVRMAKHYGATVIASCSVGKHAEVLRLGADYVVDYRTQDLVDETLRITGGRGADLVLESVGGSSFTASIAATRRVTGRVVVYGIAAGDAYFSNRDLNFKHPVQLIGLHLGILSTEEPVLFGAVMAELATLRTAGILPPGDPTVFPLEQGPVVLARMGRGTTIGKLALRP